MKEKSERKSAAAGATDAALRLLSIRQRSVREMGAKLREKGFGADEIEATARSLIQAGYLDDERFARSLAESRARHKSWGPARIARDLASRGVDEQTIKRVLAEGAPEDEVAAAAYRRWLRINGPNDGPKAREKAFRHLRARGFSTAAIMKALGGLPVDDDQR